MKSIAVFVLPLWAAALHSEYSSLIRRQNELQFGAGGDTKRVQAISREEKADVLARRAKGPGPVQHVVHDLCNYNYVAGPTKTNNCTDPDTQSLIEDQSMCEAAAKKSDTSCSDGSCMGQPFKKLDVDFNKFPMRCFKMDDGKWYFNPTPYWPTDDNMEGTPVCVTVEYLNGTADSDDCGSDEYENIDDENECRTCATCLSKIPQSQFRVGVNSTDDQAKFPKGCHIMSDGTTVQFNQRTDGSASAAKGTPLCKLKTTS